jgi:hypothetical protein
MAAQWSPMPDAPDGYGCASPMTGSDEKGRPLHSMRRDPARWGDEFRQQVDHLMTTTTAPRQLAVPIPGRHTRQLPELLAIAEEVMSERGYRLAATQDVTDPNHGVLAHATFTRTEAGSRLTSEDRAGEPVEDEHPGSKDEATCEISGQGDARCHGATEGPPPIASPKAGRRFRWRWWR